MESEALRNIRTMRQVKSSLEVAGKQRIKTTSSLSKTSEESERLESISLTDNQTTQILGKEKARAAKFEASVERSRQKLLKSRGKMAYLIQRNQALTNLRHEIQKDRDQKRGPLSLSKPPLKQGNSSHSTFHGIELRY